MKRCKSGQLGILLVSVTKYVTGILENPFSIPQDGDVVHLFYPKVELSH